MQTIILKGDRSQQFNSMQYPDGQKKVVLNMEKLDVKQPIRIECRIKNFAELEVLGCLLAALNKNDFFVKHLHFVYLFGLRSDRAFGMGQPNYCRDVLAPIINGWMQKFNIETMSILWPFQVLPVQYNYFNNCHCVDAVALQFANKQDIKMVSGDETASVYEGRDVDVIPFKKRDVDGDLDITINSTYWRVIGNDKKLLVVDDLCDGGATFVALGKKIKGVCPGITLDLLVYHGLFSQGFESLSLYYDTIYCTNSYQDISHPRVKQLKVI